LPVVWTKAGGGTFCGAWKTYIWWNKEMASGESEVSICSIEGTLQLVKWRAMQSLEQSP
jgi:hypothetical protein